MVKDDAPGWVMRLRQYLGRRRDRAGGDAPSIDSPTPGTAEATESAGSYDDWMKRFMALEAHAAIIAGSSAIPVVAAIGHDLEVMCGRLKELSDVMEAWQPRQPRQWPALADSARLVDDMRIEGTLKMFELIEKILDLTLSDGAAATNDPLEQMWSESTKALLDELGQLRDEYTAAMGRPGR
jgi:hypothetical protein